MSFSSKKFPVIADKKKRPWAMDFSGQPEITSQSHKNECDINSIIEKYRKTQLLSHVNAYEGNYGDFTDVTDYQSAWNAVRDAGQKFMSLPSTIREQFNNDPQQLLNFVQNKENYEAAVEKGLLPASPKQKTVLPDETPKNDDLTTKN